MADGNQGDQQCSFGIKKIVDCKIDQTGKQLYKVKWEATWEPADSLSSCQHLIDEFWGFVNKAKTNEDIAQQHRKRMRLDPSAGQNGTVGLGPHHMLNEDSKDEVQRLIARTNATQPGSLMTPSDLLNTQQNQMGVPRTPTRAPQSPFAQNTRMPFSQSPGQFNQQQQQFGSPQTGFPNQSPMSSPSTRGKAPGFGKAASNIKSEQDESITTWSVSNLPPLSANQEEIAEICYVCKNCKKPLSKHKSTWRRHYSSCAQQFPYNCHVCGKGFTMKFRMEGHVAKVHGEEPLIKKEVMKKSRVKPEPGTTIKSEPIDYHYGDQRLDLEVDNQLRLPSLPDNVTTDNNKKTSERHHPNSDIKMESFEMVFGFR